MTFCFQPFEPFLVLHSKERRPKCVWPRKETDKAFLQTDKFNMVKPGSLRAWEMLVGKNHVFGVTQLLQVGLSGCLDQGWGTTHQDERVLPRRREVLLDHVGGHKARAVLPA